MKDKKAGEDGLLSDDEIRKLRKPVPQGIELIDSGDLFIDYRDIAKAQKALDDKRWIEEIKGFGTTEVWEKEDKDNYMAYLVPTEFLKMEGK